MNNTESLEQRLEKMFERIEDMNNKNLTRHKEVLFEVSMLKNEIKWSKELIEDFIKFMGYKVEVYKRIFEKIDSESPSQNKGNVVEIEKP